MEINEGNVRVFTEQRVTLGDQTVQVLSQSDLGRLKIERELIRLTKKVDELRNEVMALRKGQEDAPK